MQHATCPHWPSGASGLLDLSMPVGSAPLALRTDEVSAMVTFTLRSPMEACSMKYQEEKLLCVFSTCMHVF